MHHANPYSLKNAIGYRADRHGDAASHQYGGAYGRGICSRLGPKALSAR